MENWERNEYFTELIDADYRKSRATYIQFLQSLDLRSALVQTIKDLWTKY